MRGGAEYLYSLDDLVFGSIQDYRNFFVASLHEIVLERRPGVKWWVWK